MNLVTISQLHWRVACLMVNAGYISDEVSKATDYGAIAKAIGAMEKGFVTVPYINQAAIGFKANAETNTCIYGIGAINSISNELAKDIIRLRPYTSFKDFIEKCVETKIVQPSKVYNLIKAGCFDEFNSNRVEVMVEFINYLVPDKTKLTTANISKMISFGMIPKEMQQYVAMQEFKKLVFNKNNCVKMYNKTQGLYKIPGNLLDYFNSLIANYMEAIEYNENGELCLKSKEFDKVFKEQQAPFLTWLNSEEALNLFNYCCKNEVWLKYCLGNIPKWEMDSLCYYTKEHELDFIPLEQYYTIDDFKTLPPTPVTFKVKNERTGREYNRYKLSLITGTVIDKNKTKNIITLITKTGVVDVKLHKSTFVHYDRKTTEEKSWFQRGTKLIIAGYRREENFIPKAYSDSIYQNNIMKIEIENDKVKIKRERSFEENDNNINF